jgi:hypothetical protein
VTRPQEVETLRELKVLKVACGVWHTAAVVEHTTADGLSSLNRLYTWGDGDKCRLGHGNKVCFCSMGNLLKVWLEHQFQSGSAAACSGPLEGTQGLRVDAQT